MMANYYFTRRSERFNRSLFYKILDICIILMTLGAAAVSGYAAECGPIEVCAEVTCKPSRDCSSIGSAGIGTDGGLARARCETQQQAELNICRDQLKEMNADCSIRQQRQLQRCVAAESTTRIPNVCDALKELIAASHADFQALKGTEEKEVGHLKWWPARKNLVGSNCYVAEGTSVSYYYGCELYNDRDFTLSVQQMSTIAYSMKNCLGEKWVLDTEQHRKEANDLSLNIRRSSDPGPSQITLRTWKANEKFVVKFYIDVR